MTQKSPPVFFPVSTDKLVTMSIVTFGFYEVYWAYKNWQLIKSRDESKIQPIWRAIFLLLFFYPLINKVKTVANSNGVSTNYSPILITIIWVFLIIMSRVSSELPLLLVGIVSLIIDCLFGLLLIPVQEAANQVNATMVPDHLPNDRFSGWNIIAISCWSIYLMGVLYTLIIIRGWSN
jgi:hypothetical protein